MLAIASGSEPEDHRFDSCLRNSGRPALVRELDCESSPHRFNSDRPALKRKFEVTRIGQNAVANKSRVEMKCKVSWAGQILFVVSLGRFCHSPENRWSSDLWVRVPRLPLTTTRKIHSVPWPSGEGTSLTKRKSSVRIRPG